ncbi:hypothetical protein H0E87_001815 [Populus deltoides]|uniref:non-specific serine/threonine protein kinase n=1 Tax=Populus deltoides TaxID=3696 RepID=A0A8T2ZT64_POPDE|nr:hypothetical protein H0E87_001815 [Populus deltoides]
MIYNDEELSDLVMKEINVMKALKGHPNVVTLYAHTILDMGRTKEALLVMEFCEKSLVNVLESRGAAYFEEKQVLSIFRDVCNAVFAMHSQSLPIAHRDLKAENLLLGPDGLWKLCDFGSTSTNHKRFEKPEEMGIEEDNIRKHTTPAYRAPEALGCLLYRICYFKSAFDGESKLQILNGNYRIPDLPKYSSPVTDLIRDMLQASPDDRPDITQASALLDWILISINLEILTFCLLILGFSHGSRYGFSVNEQLPVNMQKPLPDGPPEMQSAGRLQCLKRSPPPPPSSGGGGQLGAFWSTPHAKDSLFVEDKSRPKFDEEPSHNTSQQDRNQSENRSFPKNASPAKQENVHNIVAGRRNVHNKSHVPEDGASKDFELTFSQKDMDHGMERPKASKPAATHLFQDEAFSTFVAEFDSNKLNSRVSNDKEGKEEALEAEIERLKEQLKQVNSEKAEITSKFEKLSAICRSQRQEIQELKQTLAARTPYANKYQASSRIQPSASPPQEKSDWSTPSPESKSWQAFADDNKSRQKPVSKGNSPQSVRTRNAHQNKQAAELTSNIDSWGFGSESFTAVPAASSQISGSNTEAHSGGSKIMESKPATQPAGWAGF